MQLTPTISSGSPERLRRSGLFLCLTAGLGLGWGGLSGARVWGDPAPASAAGAGTGSGSVGAPAWEDRGDHRRAPLTVPAQGRHGFVVWPADRSHVRFTNRLDDTLLAQNQILEVGSGVALGDVDGDGRVDLYLCALQGGNRLYRNLGAWQFADVTAAAGVACPNQHSTGAVLADIDGDDDLDLLVNAIGRGTRLFENRGGGKFAERPDAGLVAQGGSTSMALADLNGDGSLDLYVANYHHRTIKDSRSDLDVKAGYVDGKFVVSRPDLFSPIFTRSGGVNLFERGEPDVLYLNDGRGRFSAVSWTNGAFLDAEGQALAEAPRDWGLSVGCRDLNQDGRPDLYVCNDFFHSPDRVWMNEGGGRFRASAPFAFRQQSMSSMAVDFADLDRDGADDILVVDMMSREHRRRQTQRGSLIHVQAASPVRDPRFQPEVPRNTLFRNRGDGTFAEIAQAAGLEASEWSWSVGFLDVDLDGFEDVLITTGNLRNANDGDIARQRGGRMDGAPASKARPVFPRLETAKLAFRNRGDLTFEESGPAWGFDAVGVAHGMAMADLDADGDLDVVVNEMHRPAGLYRNDSVAPRIAVRLRGRPPNTRGIGARIEVRGGAVLRQAQEMMSGGRYLAGDAPERMFAAGAATNRLEIEVRWPAGARSLIRDAPANYCYEVIEPASGGGGFTRAEQAAPTSDLVWGRDIRTPILESVGAKLKRSHQEAEFDDFERQPMLSRRLSQLGPGVSWADLDGDGWEDLVLGGGAGEHQVLFRNDGQAGEFRALRRADSRDRDQTTVLALTTDAGRRILTGHSNYEDGRTNGTSVSQYDPDANVETAVASAGTSSVGPLAVGVLDGRHALFVGGRVRPGRYPEAPESRLYRALEGRWHLDTNATAVLAGAGLVSGATWTDWDGDGQSELVLATEWGPVRVYAMRGGQWTELTGELGLNAFAGWWNGVAVGDFDSDGRLDLLASNWGRNSRYRRHAAQPIRLYYGDWMDLGRVDLLEAYHDPVLGKYVPFAPLDQLRQSCPLLADAFPTFAAYSRAGVDDVLGAGHRDTRFLQAGWFETTLFLNRGSRVDARPLPAEAQFAPAFGVCVGDLDGDGFEDAFLSQNFFGVDAETSRLDAGRGLWLRGDGQGGLMPVPADQSGVSLNGEQRGCALCDFDRDGRIDLAVAQNRGPVGLFRNRGGRPGIRIRLQGPAGNRDAIGATVRLRFGERLGPARHLQAGSGYWSQNSLVQVFGRGTGPTAVQVRWPGSEVVEQTIDARSPEVTLVAPAPK